MSTSSSPSISTGSCLCRKIEYDITGDPMYAVICHCDNCQKASGTAFLANLFFKQAQVTVYDPHHHLQWFEDNKTSSGRPIFRGFCNACGSTTMIKPTTLPGKKPLVIVCSGTVDNIQSKGERWTPSVEGFCDPWKRSWIGQMNDVKSFGKAFRFKL